MRGEDNRFLGVTYRSRRQRGAENIFEEEEEVRENQPEVGQVENMGDANEERGMQILESLAAGQQQLTQLITQLLANQTNQNHGSNNGAGGSNVNNGADNNNEIPVLNNTGIPMQIGARTTSRTVPRPLLPNFLGNQPTENQGQQVPGETFQDYLREYQALGDEFQAAMSLQDFCTIKYRNRPRDHNRVQQNKDLARKLGKLSIPSFDGSNRSTARAWVQKLDTYFQLNPMTEAEAIKFATLHLDGEAHEWWYHGLVTLGHATITSYLDFTQKLMERFDKKDPELHFRELAQLKQEGSPDAYITEFQKLAVTVSDISEQRLVMLFIEGLLEPLRGWVKAFKPETLQDAIVRTRDMEGAVPKTKKNFPNPLFHRKARTRSLLGRKVRVRKGWTRQQEMS
jgi:hypothetical protein